LSFATLGGKYPWLDFHQLEMCHARHTIKREPHQGSLYLPVAFPLILKPILDQLRAFFTDLADFSLFYVEF